MTTEDLTCQELVELVTNYLEGALEPYDSRRFDEHLGYCDGCTAYLDQFRQTINLTGQVTPGDLGADAEAALLDAFRSWKSGK